MFYEPNNKKEWHEWLKINHDKSNGVYVIIERKDKNLTDIDILEIQSI
jgi:hypothetical protein